MITGPGPRFDRDQLWAQVTQRHLYSAFFTASGSTPLARGDTVVGEMGSKMRRKLAGFTASRRSQKDDCRQAVIFELTDGVDIVYKLCQLELRLAIFTMHRFKTKKIDTTQTLCTPSLVKKIVALSGLIHAIDDRDILSSLFEEKVEFKATFPHISALRKIGLFITKTVGKTDFQGVMTPCWVQIVESLEDATKPSNTRAFMVSPAMSNVDALTDAVKAKVEANTGDRVNALTMKVYACVAEGVWKKVRKAGTALVANSEDSSYHVLIP